MSVYSVAGVRIEVGPADRLTDGERRTLERVAVSPVGGSVQDRSALQLTLEHRRRSVRRPEAVDPAAVRCHSDVVTIEHEGFSAAIDPVKRTATLRRDPNDGFPLQVTARVAMCCQLPFQGALPVHAAGVIVNGSAVVFFGPSGAGKSTLSRTSPFPVISDELVVVGTDPPAMWSAGFISSPEHLSRRYPLAALVQLAKGPRLTVHALTQKSAFRALLPSITVPASAPVWNRVLAALAQLTVSVPAFTLAWCPCEPPWPQLESHLKLNDGGGVWSDDDTAR